MPRLHVLSPDNPAAPFPAVIHALRQPNGLLAIGGDLSVIRLLTAYRHGIFPWYNAGDPLLWWSPDPRLVLFPTALHIARSLSKQLRRRQFSVTCDRDFPAVIQSCADQRQHDGTWLLPEMIRAYCTLHEHGHAHSIEVWQDGQLVGGLYGVSVGRAFFGESMFSRVTNASKIALVQLCQQLAAAQFELIDCQMVTSHLQRMGAVTLTRAEFMTRLARARDLPAPAGTWDTVHQFPLPSPATALP